MTDLIEQRAAARIRALRRDGYRCTHRAEPSLPPCQAPARRAGWSSSLGDYTALCDEHARRP